MTGKELPDADDFERDIARLVEKGVRQLVDFAVKWQQPDVTLERAQRLALDVDGACRGLRGSDERVTFLRTAVPIAKAAWDQTIEALDGVGFSQSRDVFFEQLDAALAFALHHQQERQERQALKRAWEAGDREKATRMALDILRGLILNDDRGEQNLVMLLDALGMDDAIVQGWVVMRERRRCVHAAGDLQYTHGLVSWENAMTRIIGGGGPLAADARTLTRESFFPDDGCGGS